LASDARPRGEWIDGRQVNVCEAEETVMPKFMVVGSYTHEGAKGLAKEGATARRAAIAEAAESVGGKVEAVYFAFGSDDFYVVLDLPDSAAAAAISVKANQTGTVTSRTVLLMTPEEMDAALKRNVRFRPPGA
jgi:uncharacterized protein with GYD domain